MVDNWMLLVPLMQNRARFYVKKSELLWVGANGRDDANAITWVLLLLAPKLTSFYIDKSATDDIDLGVQMSSFKQTLGAWSWRDALKYIIQGTNRQYIRSPYLRESIQYRYNKDKTGV